MAISKEIRQKVYDMYNGHCAYCGCQLELKDMQIDHIKPKYLGGEDDIFPIPITDELLLKNGFEQCGYMFKTLFIEMYEVTNGWHLHIDNYKFETAIALTIKHLHQLQNAYYLVTGNELEIKI